MSPIELSWSAKKTIAIASPQKFDHRPCLIPFMLHLSLYLVMIHFDITFVMSIICHRKRWSRYNSGGGLGFLQLVEIAIGVYLIQRA